jgi:acetyl esterase/lipase
MGAFILQSACLAASLFMASLVTGAKEAEVSQPDRRFDATRNNALSRAKAGHLDVDNNIRDLLNHPAFSGYSHLLMPWSDRTYDENMRLRDLGSLLPYHSHVDPGTVVAGLNHMIEDVNSGKPIFYDFYTEAQKRAEPARKQTGLFFFRGKPGAPFAIIAPGGGFSYVGSIHEGFPYAVEISSKGYNAFVLKYRAGHGGTVATEDLAAAISYIFRHAKALDVDIRDYALWGSSAGARMAAAVGSHGVSAFGGDDLPKPAAVVMAYTAHSDISTDEPPTFVIVGEQDGIAPPATMDRRVAALRRAGTEVEFHRYKNLGHGFGPGTSTNAEGWIGEATRFWEKFIRSGRAQEIGRE